MLYLFEEGADPEVDTPIAVRGPVATDEAASRLGLQMQSDSRDSGSSGVFVRVEEVIG